MTDYGAKLKSMTVNELMDQLCSAYVANEYGSHTKQLNLIRSEIRVRIVQDEEPPSELYRAPQPGDRCRLLGEGRVEHWDCDQYADGTITGATKFDQERFTNSRGI